MTTVKKEVRMKKLNIDCLVSGVSAEVDAAVAVLVSLGWEVVA